jgi:hypothetical protein
LTWQAHASDRDSATCLLPLGCERPPYIGLRDPELPRDSGRLDTGLEGGRTAFSLPVVSEPAPSLDAARCDRDRASAGAPLREVGTSRPRRLASAMTAASRESTSASASRVKAPGRSFGKRCVGRVAGSRDSTTTARGAAGRSGALAVGSDANRSGIGSARRRVGMASIMPPPSAPRQPSRAPRFAGRMGDNEACGATGEVGE